MYFHFCHPRDPAYRQAGSGDLVLTSRDSRFHGNDIRKTKTAPIYRNYFFK